MATESIVVTKTDGTTDYTFNLQSRNGYKSRWSDSANSTSDRRFIDIDHQLKPSGANGTDTHLLTFRREIVNATTGLTNVLTMGLVMKVPRSTDFAASAMSDMLSELQCLFNKNFMNTFVLGDTPSGDYNVTGPFNPVRA